MTDAAAPAPVAATPVAAPTPVPPPTPAPAPVAATITLTEFCMRHSKVERSVELINAFFAIETHAGRSSATEAEFVKRLAALAATPV